MNDSLISFTADAELAESVYYTPKEDGATHIQKDPDDLKSQLVLYKWTVDTMIDLSFTVITCGFRKLQIETKINDPSK